MQFITIAGNVGKDAELRQTQNGDAVLGFSVAVNNGKDKPATWYDVSVWGKRAQSLSGMIRKGDKITVMGRPTARAHEGKAYLGVMANEITLQGSSGGSGASQPPRDDGYGSAYAGEPGGGIPDDEIPF